MSDLAGIEDLFVADFKDDLQAKKIHNLQENLLGHLHLLLRDFFPREDMDPIEYAAIRTVILRSLNRANEELNLRNGYVFEEIFERPKDEA